MLGYGVGLRVSAMGLRGSRIVRDDGRWRAMALSFPQFGRRHSVNELERGPNGMEIDHVHIL